METDSYRQIYSSNETICLFSFTGSRGPDSAPGQVAPNQGAFYLLNPNSTNPVVEVQPVTLSNGLAWNRENTLLYYIDTPTNQVDVFDFDLERGLICKYSLCF